MKTLLLLLVTAAFAADSPGERTHQVAGVFKSQSHSHWVGRNDWAGRYPSYVLLNLEDQKRPSLITVEGFPIGNHLYPDSKRFLKSMRSGPRRQRASAYATLVIAGEKRTIWERSYPEPSKIQKTGDSNMYSVRERFVILERDEDFIVARLKGPLDKFEDNAKEFDEFLSSFKLLPTR